MFAADDVTAPIRADEFDFCMQRLGPFEDRPHLAVGVSGGRDSLALALLAGEWATARDGRITAVTVDHGLRAASAGEADQVSAWMGQLEISHDTLVWQNSPGPGLAAVNKSGLASEADARSARYGLLEAYCRDRGILHLLVGHHREDQLETQIMRRSRSSGTFGQAGMPAVRELPHVRVLRPLLDVPRTRITETLRARGQAWIEDPSNRDTRYARARLRESRSAGSGAEPNTEFARARVVVERKVARLAAQAVTVHPAGFARLDPALLAAADGETSLRLIANLVMCIGGRMYPPRGARLSRLADRLTEGTLGGGVTLGGCVVRPESNGVVRVVREQAAIEPIRHLIGTADTIPDLEWDGRYQVSLPTTDSAGRELGRDGDIRLGAVGSFVANEVPMHADSLSYEGLPHLVRMTLPAICHAGHFHICALPGSSQAVCVAAKARFAPKNPVAGAVFAMG